MTGAEWRVGRDFGMRIVRWRSFGCKEESMGKWFVRWYLCKYLNDYF